MKVKWTISWALYFCYIAVLKLVAPLRDVWGCMYNRRPSATSHSVCSECHISSLSATFATSSPFLHLPRQFTILGEIWTRADLCIKLGIIFLSRNILWINLNIRTQFVVTGGFIVLNQRWCILLLSVFLFLLGANEPPRHRERYSWRQKSDCLTCLEFIWAWGPDRWKTDDDPLSCPPSCRLHCSPDRWIDH